MSRLHPGQVPGALGAEPTERHLPAMHEDKAGVHVSYAEAWPQGWIRSEASKVSRVVLGQLLPSRRTRDDRPQTRGVTLSEVPPAS